ncbi:MAG: spore germination protein [Lachnospiraceae bacterium]
MPLTTNLSSTIELLHSVLPLNKSFDFISRRFRFGAKEAYLLSINGMCNLELLQRVCTNLQSSEESNTSIETLKHYVEEHIGYAQVSLCSDLDNILLQILSGPSALFVDGYKEAIIIDMRSYPTRSISEPEYEHVTKGSKDGFVETMLFNANLIRRRIRVPDLVFELQNIGSYSKTDLSIAYLDSLADSNLVLAVKDAIKKLDISALTMGSKSLQELLVPKKWYHPLPSIQITERPDVACSYLMEGYILLLVDNSPNVIILPNNFFQFTQSPEDYNKTPAVGTYFRLVRFLCIPISLLLMPVFLLLTVHYPIFSQKIGLLQDPYPPAATLLFYIFMVELILDLFKYSTSQNSSKFSGSLSVVGGLIIGDVAVSLNWATTEVLFYAALTLLASLSISSIEFADGIRLFRYFLLLTTTIAGIYGFAIGILLIAVSTYTTPTFLGKKYMWPLLPLHAHSLKTLLFRSNTPNAQPTTSVANRQK